MGDKDPEFWKMIEVIEKGLLGTKKAGLEVVAFQCPASFSVPILDAFLWVIFSGPNESKIPAYCNDGKMSSFRDEASEQAVFCDEIKKIVEDQVKEFGRNDLKFGVGFESRDRIDKGVGGFGYFR